MTRWVLVLAALLAAWGPAVAQQPVDDDPQAQDDGAWTLERLEAERAAVVEAAEGATDEERTRALSYWDRAIAAFKAIGPLKESAADFAAAREKAPNRLAAQRAELDRLAGSAPLGVTEDSTLTEVEGALDAARARLATARQAVSDVQSEASRRTARRAELPALLAAARAHASRATAPDTQESAPIVLAARAAFETVERLRSQAEVAALEAELASYEARSDLLAARIDVATREEKVARDLVAALDERLTERREAAAADAAAEARQARARAADEHPVVQRLADETSEAADARLDASQAAGRAAERLAAVRLELDELRHRRRDVDKKVQITGFTEAIALLLRRHREDLPVVATLEQRIAERKQALADTELKSFDVQERLRDVRVASDEMVDEMVAEVGTDDPALVSEVRARLMVRLESLEDALDALRTELDNLFQRLIDLDTDQRQLLREVVDYRDYIDEYVLWLADTDRIGGDELLAGLATLTALVTPETASAAFDGARAVLEVAGWRAWALLVTTLVALVVRSRVRRYVATVAGREASKSLPSFRPTAVALLAAAVTALIGPAILYAVGWLLIDAGASASAAAPLGEALQQIAVLAYGLVFLRRVSLRGGLGDVHLRWPQPGRRWLRRHAWLVAVVALPLYRLSPLVPGDDGQVVGRGMLIVSMLLLATSTFAMFRSSSVLMKPVFARTTRSTVTQFHAVWFPIAVVAPVGVAVASYAGYAYASGEFALRLFATWSLLAVVFVVNGVMLRWVTLEQRRLRLEQARRKREATIASAQAAKESDVAAEVVDDISTEELDVAQIDLQTRRLLQIGAAVVLGLGLFAIWSSIFPAFGRADAFELWSVPIETVGDDGEAARGIRVVSLGDLLAALVMTVLIVLAVRNVPGLLELLVLRRMNLEPGAGYAFSTLLRYALVIGGVMAVAPLIGVTWNRAQWLVAAVSVGLGFGLQEIFANFVSGLILLVERPIRIGDIVTVGTTEGVITKIRMRATTIRDWDRRELLVPNREFITGQLVNWTLTDPITRVVFPVGVAYGTDPKLVTETLLAVARADPLVLDEPGPQVVFRSFGDSSLNFELRTFIGTRDVWPQLVHNINSAVAGAFNRKAITIPFPQRDIHVRTYGRGVPEAVLD